MKQKKFDAILAKNNIARQIAEYSLTGKISIPYLKYRLQEIEVYLGVANQPSIEDIINNNTDPEKQYNI